MELSPDMQYLRLDNPFERVMGEIVKTHRAKAADYERPGETNGNFYAVGEQLGLSAGHSVEALIAVKQARLKVLLPDLWSEDDDRQPKNEGIEDTLLDRAVYAIIAIVLWNDHGYELLPSDWNDRLVEASVPIPGLEADIRMEIT